MTYSQESGVCDKGKRTDCWWPERKEEVKTHGHAEGESYELPLALRFLLTLINTWGIGHSRELGYAVINLVKPQPAQVINDTPLCAIKQQQRRVFSPIPKQHNTAKEIWLFKETLPAPANIFPLGLEHKQISLLHYISVKDDCCKFQNDPLWPNILWLLRLCMPLACFLLPVLFKGLLLFITIEISGVPIEGSVISKILWHRKKAFTIWKAGKQRKGKRRMKRGTGNG